MATDCRPYRPGELVISRTSFIISLTLCIFLTSTSLLALTALLYRSHTRRQQAKDARSWGRESAYLKRLHSLDNLNIKTTCPHERKHNRISLARKEVDRLFTSKYRGCLVNVPENPELGSGSPVELCAERVCEVPAVPVRAAVFQESDAGRSGREGMSLMLDERVGVWLPRGGR